jgi:lipid A biosynthesis (KDO)2-(lauroyl)-lipid IVA acyltransferase
MTESKNTAGASSLVYDTAFSSGYLHPKYWGVWFAVMLLFLISLLPRILQDGLANVLGDFFRKVNAKRRRIASINIALCFPELSEPEKQDFLIRYYRHHARSLLAFGLIWWGSKSELEKTIVIRGQENIEHTINRGRSVIFLAAHSLGLEAAVSSVAVRYLASGPFKPLKNKLVDWFIATGRSRHGGYLYSRQAGLRPIIKDVRAGNVMFYLPDEDLGKERSIFAPFFGTQKATVPVLGKMAKVCKADVLPCMAEYDEKTRRYLIHILPALKDFPTGDDYRDTVTMNEALEEIIRLCPSQYFWMMKFFKTRPEGEARIY